MYEIFAVRIIDQTSSTEQENTLDASIVYQALLCLSVGSCLLWCSDFWKGKSGSNGFEFNSEWQRFVGEWPINASSHWLLPVTSHSFHSAGKHASLHSSHQISPSPFQSHQLLCHLTGCVRSTGRHLGHAMEGCNRNHWLLALWIILWHLGGFWYHVFNSIHPEPLCYQCRPVLGHFQSIPVWEKDDSQGGICDDQHSLDIVCAHLFYPSAAELAQGKTSKLPMAKCYSWGTINAQVWFYPQPNLCHFLFPHQLLHPSGHYDYDLHTDLQNSTEAD